MREEYPHGQFSWADLASPDPESAAAFYGSLFEWERAEERDSDGHLIYTMFSIDGEKVAGVGGRPDFMADMPHVWNTYINVDNLDAVMDLVEPNGGHVILPATDISDTGRLAFIADPTGAPIGLWEPGTHRGAGTFDGYNIVAWHELATRDPQVAITFFIALFPWHINKTPVDSMDYWTISIKDQAGEASNHGGILAMDEHWPADVPGHWMVYFRVPDTDAIASRVQELGGTVSIAPFDSESGRIAIANDPQGYAFSVIGPTN